jgi:divalent metal cation (Fe/Co/Zn/Cd) transporter
MKDFEKKRLISRALWLEYFTVVYNLLEAAVSVFFGQMAGSIALIGFGLDSVIESLSGMVLIWRLRKHGKIPEEEEEKIERKASKLVALSFFILGAYVLFFSVKKLILIEKPNPSFPGIIIAILSLVIMPLLASMKYRIGRRIGSAALVADSKETLACSFLSLALLLGLGLNALFGLWQADSIAGVIIVIFLVREGIESWREGDEQSQLE